MRLFLIPVLGLVLFASVASATQESTVRPASTSSGSASSVLGFVGLGRHAVLTRLDGRTLAPLAGANRLPVSSGPWAFSPDGSRLAVSTRGGGLAIVDPVKLRVMYRVVDAGGFADVSPIAFAWAGRSTIVALAYCSCSDGSIAYVWVDLPGPFGEGIDWQVDLFQPAIFSWERTQAGLVVLGNPDADPSVLGLDELGAGGSGNVSLSLTTGSWAVLAVDHSNDRLFVISAAGMAADIPRGGSGPSISYHSVTLPSPPNGTTPRRSAAWLGSNTLALWGSDGDGASWTPAGLTFIHTNTWTTQMVDPAVTNAVAAGDALVAWTDTPDGIAVYAPSGERFRALLGHQISDVAASTNYAYVSADCFTPSANSSCLRFAVNLHTGRTTGPLRSHATPILP